MIYIDGVYREETRNEIEENERLKSEQEKKEQEHPPQPTMEERMAALEAENAELKTLLGVTENG